MFFFRYMLRDQPFLLWTWFWSACVTLYMTLDSFLRPALRDPLTVDETVATLAENARATPTMVRQLAAMNMPSACTNPLMIARELWLDRGLFGPLLFCNAGFWSPAFAEPECRQRFLALPATQLHTPKLSGAGLLVLSRMTVKQVPEAQPGLPPLAWQRGRHCCLPPGPTTTHNVLAVQSKLLVHAWPGPIAPALAHSLPVSKATHIWPVPQPLLLSRLHTAPPKQAPRL